MGSGEKSFFNRSRGDRAMSSWSEEIDGFLSLVLDSGLMKLEELNLACKDYLAETASVEIEPTFGGLCEFLISTSRLTEWQCNRLKSGQSQGFFLDGYELLNDLGTDDSASLYLAQEIATNRRVKLRITPIMPFPFPIEKPQYEVELL
jgi:hypothetical protein